MKARAFFRAIDLSFDEPLDVTLLDGTGITLARKGSDGLAGTADDEPVAFKIDTRAQGQTISIIPASYFVPGDYFLKIGPSVISDLPGNHISDPIVRNFTIRPASDVRALVGFPGAAQAPSANPGQAIGISVSFDPTAA